LEFCSKDTNFVVSIPKLFSTLNAESFSTDDIIHDNAKITDKEYQNID